MEPPGFSEQESQRAEAILAELISAEQWRVYDPVIRAARAAGLRFSIGGGIAFSLYSGHRRNTKDLDIFILPEDHQAFIRLMARAGFEEFVDYPYDKVWSYRGACRGFIMDVLWSMLNGRASFDAGWVERGWRISMAGLPLSLLPPEELIWTKLYILRRDRCDWPDLLALFKTMGPRLDWEHLLGRLGEDAPVLGGVLHLYQWLCPGAAGELPGWIWERCGLLPGRRDRRRPAVDAARVALFGGADWFPEQPHDF